jgi:hypothetical protein
MVDLKKLFEQTPILGTPVDWEKRQLVEKILRWPVLFRRVEYLAARCSLLLCLSIPFPRRDPLFVEPYRLTLQLFTIRDQGGLPLLRCQKLDEMDVHRYGLAQRRHVEIDGRLFDF